MLKTSIEKLINKIRKRASGIGVLILVIFTGMVLDGCQAKSDRENSAHHNAANHELSEKQDTLSCCTSDVPARFASATERQSGQSRSITRSPDLSDMILIQGGTFTMGGDAAWGRPDEFPLHKVRLSSFYMDRHEVTNARFREFVEATGYVTTAERKPEWEEIRKQLPPGTPRPPDSLLVAASLVFTPPGRPVSLDNALVWWSWVPGTDWKHPDGPGSSIEGKDNHPVVQVSWEDAVAYAAWAGKRLPTEAEWEYAARGGRDNTIYPWGNEPIDKGKLKANTWQGHFPNENTKRDQYRLTAPVMSFPANGYGLYDLAGNVWEWCSDWYHAEYYAACAAKGIVVDPKGPGSSFDPDDPYAMKRVTRGGSFLCTDQYCSGFRVSARMKTSWDSSLEHTGFRCVVELKQ